MTAKAHSPLGASAMIREAELLVAGLEALAPSSSPATVKAHSPLGASASDRWLKCPGSIRLSAGVDRQQDSIYANEGTAAHALAEWCLRTEELPGKSLGWWVSTEGQIKKQAPAGYDPLHWFEIDTEMVDAVETYVEYVQSRFDEGDEIEFECRFHLEHLNPLFFGTADCVIYKPATRHLVVIDYKHGKGVAVEALNNPQLLYYALGAASTKHNRGVETVEAVVVQPRCPHPAGPVRVWEADAIDMVEHASGLVAGAARTEQADAELVAGDHCRFCPAAPFCPALKGRVFEIVMADVADSGDIHLSDPTRFSPEALAKVLGQADMIKGWLKRLEEHAHHEAEAGRPVPGFKLVAKRATRFFVNQTQAKTVLMTEYGLSEDDIMTTPELRSPAQVEALLPRKQRGELKDLIDSKSSGTNLVPESDPRPAATSEAASEFAAVEAA